MVDLELWKPASTSMCYVKNNFDSVGNSFEISRLVNLVRIQRFSILGFPLIWAVLRPTHGWLPFAPMIDTPKGFSSKMTLEVAPRGLDIATAKV